MSKTNRKWLYLVAGVLVVALIGVVAVSNLSGDVFQGRVDKSLLEKGKKTGQKKDEGIETELPSLTPVILPTPEKTETELPSLTPVILTTPTPVKTFDSDGRLTESARLQAPPIMTLNYNSLTPVHPELYGTNYYSPGTYTVGIGDGFGKGDYLIKITDIEPLEDQGYLKIEAFKRESNGQYYNIPIDPDLKRITYSGSFQTFDIPLETVTFPFEVTDDHVTVNYLESCNTYYDYCTDPSSNHYQDVPSICYGRCPFEPNPGIGTDPGEIQAQSGIYSAIFPEGYIDQAQAQQAVEIMEQCYENTLNFLGYSNDKLRLGLKVMLSDTYSGMATGRVEFISGKRAAWQFSGTKMDVDFYHNQLSTVRCPTFFALAHELTHTVTKEILGDNYGLNEGLAEFTQYQNSDWPIRYICLDNGWRLGTDSETVLNNYASLSTDSSDGQYPPFDYYKTGYCFWEDIVKVYGYPAFVEIMQALYTKGRDIHDYNVLGVMESVIGGPFSQEILNRYSLTRDATEVEKCNNCEMFL